MQSIINADDQNTHPSKVVVHHGNVWAAGINYLPSTRTVSGNQSSFVLAVDQARPLPYIALFCSLVYDIRLPEPDFEPSPKWFAQFSTRIKE